MLSHQRAGSCFWRSPVHAAFSGPNFGERSENARLAAV
jgi:hypothetical protein